MMEMEMDLLVSKLKGILRGSMLDAPRSVCLSVSVLYVFLRWSNRAFSFPLS